jgi:hypothetical protein
VIRNGYVYFVRRVDGEGPIKIGFSGTPWTRLNTLDVSSPYELRLVAKIKAPPETELRFHNLFRDAHVRREWFRPIAELLVTIERINAGTFDIEELPEPFALICSLRPKRRGWSKESKRRARENRRLAKERHARWNEIRSDPARLKSIEDAVETERRLHEESKAAARAISEAMR